LSVAFRQNGEERVSVDRVSFDIAEGETVALVGESGSGKSVSALSVLKLLPYPSASHPSGEILFNGKDLMKASEPELRRVRGNDITMIFQEPMTRSIRCTAWNADRRNPENASGYGRSSGAEAHTGASP
jgi:microcin C transport system ATP-binding protein